MIGLVLAKRYAKAIIDLAEESGLVTEIGDELDRIAELFAGSHELVHLFSDPKVGPEFKEKVLEEILGKGELHDLTKRFVHVLLLKNRLIGIGEIAVAYRHFSDQLSNRIRAKVISATSLEKEDMDRIREVLSRMSGRDVILEMEIDESILGGIVTHMGSHVYDGSLRNQLQQIKENLSRGR